ncbi:enoyl-CoA hydratase/isomerase family protein [Clostridium estertheticum]|uniref:enoyl-CoA hydratase-related protein n=1 Tax=Clostridium estertheticum TaxID=238834 RepID=UPI0013EEABE1|nr:enoyl-CoA hydratase-related protein [Clostridium estertheticum]MBZ9609076.1 enoyl-CoA hydratase/isomerase family protein [Clostridium estertheticum]
MDYKTLIVGRVTDEIYSIKLNRCKERNSINSILVQELQNALDILEDLDSCKVIVIEGQDGYFCTGMDFQAFTNSNVAGAESTAPDPNEFINTMKRISEISKFVIAKVDGQVIAGGVGLVAACDYVVATPKSIFSLPEAIWGLLPALVTPYLIRRIGYWKAYRMTITTLPMLSEEALSCNLIDEVTTNLDSSILKLCKRVSRINPKTVKEIKRYFKKMWIINDSMENCAVEEIEKLTSSTEVKEVIENYVLNKKFPWEK